MTPTWVSRFIQPLETAGIDYAIGGGVASSIYGEPRMTQDVDVILALRPAEIGRLVEAFSSPDFYLPPREVLAREVRRETSGHVNVLDLRSGAKADLYFAGDDPLNALALRTRVRRSLGGFDAWLASPEYLVIRKLEWYREGASARQLRDIRGILAGQETIDRGLIERLVASRSLERWWQEAIDKPAGS